MKNLLIIGAISVVVLIIIGINNPSDDDDNGAPAPATPSGGDPGGGDPGGDDPGGGDPSGGDPGGGDPYGGDVDPASGGSLGGLGDDDDKVIGFDNQESVLQKQRLAAAAAAQKLQQEGQDNAADFQKKVEQMLNDTDKVLSSDNEKLQQHRADDQVKENQKVLDEKLQELNTQLKNKQLSEEDYLKKLQIEANKQHQDNLDAMKKLGIQVTDEEKKMKIESSAEHKKRQDKLKSQKEKDRHDEEMERLHSKDRKTDEEFLKELHSSSDQAPAPMPVRKLPLVGGGSIASSGDLNQGGGGGILASGGGGILGGGGSGTSARYASVLLPHTSANRRQDTEDMSVVKAVHLEAAKKKVDLEYHMTDPDAPREYRKTLRKLWRVQLGILDAQTPVDAHEAENSASKQQFDILNDAYHVCLKEVGHMPHASCRHPCKSSSKCNDSSLLIKHVKICAPNYYPPGVCDKKCNPDIADGSLQPCQHAGCSQLMLFEDGVTCGCPGDMRFKDRTTCKTSVQPDDRANSACLPMFGGANCDQVDTKFTSAVRENLLDLKHQKPDKSKPSFKAVCPAKHQYADREACLKGSACVKKPNPSKLADQKCCNPDGHQPCVSYPPNAYAFTGPECTDCLPSDGISKSTRREIIECNGDFFCKCPSRYNFADEASCDVHVESSPPSSATVSGKRSLIKYAASHVAGALVAARATSVVDSATRRGACKLGYDSLPEEPFCQVCADGFTSHRAKDGSLISCEKIPEDETQVCSDPELEPPNCNTCKNRNKVFSGSKCVCNNPSIIYQPHGGSCTTEAPVDAENLKDHGFAVFKDRMLKATSFVSDWFKVTDFPGKPGISPCPAPCKWRTKDEALKACAHWNECHGVLEYDDTEFPDEVPLLSPSPAISAKASRILNTTHRFPSSKKVVLPVSAKAAVFVPIHSEKGDVLSPTARQAVRPKSPRQSTTIYGKICKGGKDPDKDCTQCLSPYVSKTPHGECKLPPQFDPSRPSECKAGSGLDPDSGCTKCINSNMRPNANHMCVCDESKPFDPEACGDTHGTETVRCRPGSGLHAPDCTQCSMPKPNAFFVPLHDHAKYCARPTSLIKTYPLESGHNPADARNDCFENCITNDSCNLVEFSESSGCSLYSGQPSLHCPTNDKAAELFQYQHYSVPRWREDKKTCECPYSGQTVDDDTGVCKCSQNRYSAATCAEKIDGIMRLQSDKLTFVQAKQRCSEMGKDASLASVYTATQQKKLDSLVASLNPNEMAYLNAQKIPVSGKSKMWQWQDTKENFYDATADKKVPSAFVDSEFHANTSSSEEKNCLAVRRKGDKAEWVAVSCDEKHAFVCETDRIPVCQNDDLDPTKDCKVCKNPNFAPDPTTQACTAKTSDVNPEWTASVPHPPVTKYENLVSSQLEYMSSRDEQAFSKITPFVFGKKPVSKDNAVNECAEACVRMGKEKECQGFMLGASPEFDVHDDHTCIFINGRSGLGKDASGKTLAKKDANRSTYLLQYCSDDRKQYWTDSPCTTYKGTELTPAGTCPPKFGFADPYHCETHSQCATSGMQDSRLAGNPGKCERSMCFKGVESSDPKNGKYCDTCKYKNTIGDITGDLTKCMQCDTNQWPFDPRHPQDCKCAVPGNRDPKTNCIDCLPGYGGVDCDLTKDTCHGRGVPTELATIDYPECKCDTNAKDEKGSFEIHMAGHTCNTCADGYGPEPDLNGTYACSVRISDTKCGPLHLPIGSKVDPRDPSKTACDCRKLNKSYTKPEHGLEPLGHWSGPVCDKCEEKTKDGKHLAYGGVHCNLDRSHCNERGTPGMFGKYGAAESPECNCDPETHFRSGALSTCANGDCTGPWYGKGCDVPENACGAVNGVQFGPDPAFKKEATLEDPKCLCDSPELNTGMTYVKEEKGPSKCVCVDPLVLLKDSNPPKCVDKHEYCYNRGVYDPNHGTCTNCKAGYTGARCDKCATGFANIDGIPLDSVVGKCTNVHEYCNEREDTTKKGSEGNAGWDDTNKRCFCLPGYDNMKNAQCLFCEDGYRMYNGRCVSILEACGPNAMDLDPKTNECMCKIDMQTGAFFAGGKIPFGPDGKTKQENLTGPSIEMKNGQIVKHNGTGLQVCQYSPELCKYPRGVPTDDGQCVCSKPFYTGANCEFAPQDCYFRGTPKDDKGNCKCDIGSNGPHCEYTREVTCNERADPDYNGNCLNCDHGFQGLDCSYPPNCKHHKCRDCATGSCGWIGDTSGCCGGKGGHDFWGGCHCEADRNEYPCTCDGWEMQSTNRDGGRPPVWIYDQQHIPKVAPA